MARRCRAASRSRSSAACYERSTRTACSTCSTRRSAAQVLRERRDDAGTYEFTHALIRQTLYDELSTPRRVLLHRQIGEALEALYGDRASAHLGRARVPLLPGRAGRRRREGGRLRRPAPLSGPRPGGPRGGGRFYDMALRRSTSAPIPTIAAERICSSPWARPQARPATATGAEGAGRSHRPRTPARRRLLFGRARGRRWGFQDRGGPPDLADPAPGRGGARRRGRRRSAGTALVPALRTTYQCSSTRNAWRSWLPMRWRGPPIGRSRRVGAGPERVDVDARRSRARATSGERPKAEIGELAERPARSSWRTPTSRRC